MSCIVYLDGGEGKDTKGNKVTGYGICILKDDDCLEYFGGTYLGNGFKGYHELYAFIETVIRLKLLGINPLDVIYYVDDQSLAYGHFYIHENSCIGSNRGRDLLNRIKMLCDTYYVNMYDEVINVLCNARFNKVRGHQKCVYNQRVDYLCSYGIVLSKGNSIKFYNFNEWLSRGFDLFNCQERYRYYPPFSSLISCEDSDMMNYI